MKETLKFIWHEPLLQPGMLALYSLALIIAAYYFYAFTDKRAAQKKRKSKR